MQKPLRSPENTLRFSAVNFLMGICAHQDESPFAHLQICIFAQQCIAFIIKLFLFFKIPYILLQIQPGTLLL